MIAAAIYAATTHRLNIFALVPVAALGAICGDQIGYFIGRWIGYRVLRRLGRRVGLSEERLELGRFLFRKYGGRVVFLGRFVAVLRTFVALLAGANRMPWHSFLLWNALGGGRLDQPVRVRRLCARQGGAAGERTGRDRARRRPGRWR